MARGDLDLAGAAAALSFFEVPGDTIWGATGSMLRQLLAIAPNRRLHPRWPGLTVA